MSAAALELPTIEPQPATSAVKFHLSLNVTDLDRSIAFLTALFGRRSPAELVEWQRRLEMAGIATLREDGVECCYSRQTKFWVQDPDNNRWEIYVLEEDIDHRGVGSAPQVRESLSTCCAPKPQTSSGTAAPANSVWQHQLGTPLPAKIFALDASTDEARLSGSFNAPHSPAARRGLIAEAFRILKAGGTITLHILTGTKSLALPFGTLPGPASYVTFVPTLAELEDDLAAAGFERAERARYGDKPCFTQDGVEMRETLLIARKAN
jgi:hypothetical protein